jgi:hypothetical protein
MKTRIKLIALICMLTTAAWAQEESEPDAFVYPETVVTNWADTPLQVTVTNPKAIARDFARAVCSQFIDYPPNKKMIAYLDNPAGYNYNKDGFLIDDAPANGFIKCDMAWQCDYNTEVCYWRRPNKHLLVGVLMQVGSEGEGVQTRHSLLFYDYNPKTRVMTPQPDIVEDVEHTIAFHRGTPNLQLPKEGKDIEALCVEWIGSEDEDFRFDRVVLKWKNNTFKTGAER